MLATCRNRTSSQFEFTPAHAEANTDQFPNPHQTMFDNFIQHFPTIEYFAQHIKRQVTTTLQRWLQAHLPNHQLISHYTITTQDQITKVINVPLGRVLQDEVRGVIYSGIAISKFLCNICGGQYPNIILNCCQYPVHFQCLHA